MFQRLKQGLARTKQALVQKVEAVVRRNVVANDAFFEEIEETFLLSDMGPRTAAELVETIRARCAAERPRDSDTIVEIVRTTLADALKVDTSPAKLDPGLNVIMMTGVNGSGKTTSIGKLAARFQGEGRKVMLAACDTFRAAAIEQLEVWAERNSVPIVRQKTGTDPSAVIFDAITAARARGIDVLLADTAGRLHTKLNLMEELKKLHRVAVTKAQATSLRNWLVLDATLGQNALEQARQFNEAVPVDALVLTKMDGTAKGGFVFSVLNELKIPIAFVGVGEKIDDLMPFDAAEFAKALLGKDMPGEPE